MALQAGVSLLRQAVLGHMRVPVVAAVGTSSSLPTLNHIITRGFGGGFLDKTQVTDRVLHVTKHFEKIDASKVRAGCCGFAEMQAYAVQLRVPLGCTCVHQPCGARPIINRPGVRAWRHGAHQMWPEKVGQLQALTFAMAYGRRSRRRPPLRRTLAWTA